MAARSENDAPLRGDLPQAPGRGRVALLGVAAACVLLPTAAHAGASDAAGAGERDSAVAIRLDLRTAVERALAANPDLGALRGDVSAATAQRDRSEGERWPTVRAVGSWTEFRRSQRLFPAGVPGDPVVASHHAGAADLVASAPLFTAGRIDAGVLAARGTERSVRAAYDRARAQIVYRVGALWYQIVAERELLRALEASENGLAEHYRRLVALVAERKAAQLDAQRIEIRIASVHQRRIEEEAALRARTLALAALAGFDVTGPPVVVVGELPAPAEAVTPPAAARAHAMEARADRRAAVAGVEAQAARVEVARAGRWGQVSLVGSYGVRWQPGATRVPASADPAADVGQIGILIDVPLYLGGRLSADVREQEARLESSRERLRQLELALGVEVESALADVESAIRRVALGDRAAALAAEAFRVERERHAAGKSTISDVLGADADLVDAASNRARARADYWIARAALVLATGEDP